MNGKERAGLAFSHQEADRVPIFELTIDNPTAAYGVGRPTQCRFVGRARGFLCNRAPLNGTIEKYHQQRIEDKIALGKKLELDVFPSANQMLDSPSDPDQVNEFTWRFRDPATGQWGVYCGMRPIRMSMMRSILPRAVGV